MSSTLNFDFGGNPCSIAGHTFCLKEEKAPPMESQSRSNEWRGETILRRHNSQAVRQYINRAVHGLRSLCKHVRSLNSGEGGGVGAKRQIVCHHGRSRLPYASLTYVVRFPSHAWEGTLGWEQEPMTSRCEMKMAW